MDDKKIKRAKAVNTEQGLTEEIKRFKNEAEISKNIRETDTIQRTYYIKVKNWLYLKKLSTDLAFKRGEKVNLNDLVNEALELVLEKYGIAMESEHENKE